jgi:orotate phosphoribosyltransferase
MHNLPEVYPAHKQLLIYKIKQTCLTFGDFTLASGKKSTFYLDIRKLVLSSSAYIILTAMHHLILDYIRQGNLIDSIGGPETGANALLGGLISHSQGILVDRAFTVRKDARLHGLGGLVVGNLQKGDRTFLVEDVATSGETIQKAAEAVLEFGGTVHGALAVVDRQEGCTERCAAMGFPFRGLVTRADLGLDPA